jgi:SPP1 gp7 family putative phage head morphogenesis protein
MDINSKIFDRIIDHMTDVRLYEEGVQLQNKRIMQRHRKRLKDVLIKNIRNDVKPEVRRFGKEMLGHQKGSMLEFSTSQLDFHSDNLNKELKGFYKVNRPRSKELLAEITGSNIKGVKSITENVRNISSGELVRIQTKVKKGLATGLSHDAIVKDVLKTTKLTENQARALTRTSITSTQTLAISKVAGANSHVIKGFVFTAILDSRTSPICSFHNGKIYDVDDKRFKPPLHWNCRSTLVPIIRAKDELLESALLAQASGRLSKTNLLKKKPESLTGIAPKVESFGAWLKRQSFDTQTKILGTMDKANLFRLGKLKYDQFVTPKGKGLSIQALRNRAANATSVFAPKQKLREVDIDIAASRPSSLIKNPKNKDSVRQLYVLDSDDFSKTMSLTDYKGTSLVGKTASRRRVGNEFDERNFSADPLTGEIKNNNVYDPDFNLYQERIDFMRNSKLLSTDEKDFIESVAGSLDDKISVNQQTVVIENLRVVLERYAKDKTPWKDLSAVLRAENRFSVQNVSRLLDTRSREKSKMFVSYLSKDTPQVQIMGKYYELDNVIENQLKDQRYIDSWRSKEGQRLATKVYLSGRAPARVYFRNLFKKYPSKKKVVKRLQEDFLFAKQYKSFKDKFKREPSDSWLSNKYAKGRESIRRILDLEFINQKKRPSSKLLDDTSINVITKAVKLVSSGQSTDYDSLAINIGKMFSKDFENIIPFTKHTLKDHHKEGSRILDLLVDQNLIRVQFRGKTRRGVLDLDTGRSSGGWADTISREVTVIDKRLLRLQEAERRVTIARRLGTTSSRDRLYVKANKKTFVDSRGNDTGIPIISRDKFADYDPKQIDREMAQMLNHVMDVEYGVDKEFFGFMDDIVRFRDPRGNSKYYDSINEFRHEILNRGEQGYGLMSTAKYHAQRGKNFRTQAFIDSRGRVYHRGYLTPTGGELVRPFLNSGRAINMSDGALDELKIHLGAMIGPGTEALTQNGRRAIFKRNRESLVELGNMMMSTTQRDRRMREFLEHPLVRTLEGPEVPKLARMALEYTRIENHLNKGKPLNTFKTKLMIENDASSSGAQIIGLSTGDRAVSQASNVLATSQKNRLYDLVAMDTVNDPDFLKIPALRDANLTWEDLAKAAKSQNMVSFYGAGDATKTANVASKLSAVLDSKGFVTVTKGNLSENLRIVDGKIKIAERLDASTVVSELTSFRKELVELINNNEPVGRTLLKQAQDIHPDVGEFVEKLTNARRGIIGPKEFSEVSRIMSNNLAQRAPVTDNFINYWKDVAKVFVEETEKVDIPWVTFDGKIMTQRYRPKIQERIEFRDPVTNRRIANIYESSAEDGKLLGKGSLNDARIGLGVNGNHSNDAVIVRRFHLWGQNNNVQTATIHDAFFTNIGEARRAKDALRTIYADALEGDTIRKTLREMRRQGLSYKSYLRLLKKAKEQGLIDPPNKITRQDILAPLKLGEDWYGIGP